ncbi:MAG TPA: ribulose-phosphate 3-epimerase [Phycisphaerales bacterium]|nr:ribulose-phosphate 3-epimerase [Phycisphaerales bacterium]
MQSFFRAPPRLPLVAPSILSSDFANLAADCRDALAAGGDLLHVDVMDGHFVPNLTLGPALTRSLHRALPGAFLDVHLMVRDPGVFVGPFIEAGAGNITFHVEAIGLEGCVRLAERVRGMGATAGIAINPPTQVRDLLGSLDAFDLILVMSVNPGFGGQAFIPEVLAKTREISPRLRPEQRLEMDGGISPETAPAVREAGCDVLVAGSSLFGRPSAERRSLIRAIRGA